jgi:predicted nucleotidyltransferase
MKVTFDFQGVLIEREYYQGYIPKVGDHIEHDELCGFVDSIYYDLKKCILLIHIL